MLKGRMLPPLRVLVLMSLGGGMALQGRELIAPDSANIVGRGR